MSEDASQVSPRPNEPRRLSPLGALRVVDPAAWVAMIDKAMRAANGRVPPAATALGVSTRQLQRMLRDPLLADVERAAHGTRPDDDVDEDE